MVAKVDKVTLGNLTSKAVYYLLKEKLEDNAIYLGVANVPDSEYQLYAASLDSESVYWGGSDSEYGYDDKTFYNQSTYSMHKCLKGGITRVVPRRDWVYGGIYNSYPSRDYYVLAKTYEYGYAQLNVYACVFSPRTPSTASPVGSTNTPVTYADGYVWKYLYTISNSQAVRFLNDNWMPVTERIPTDEFEYITTDSLNYSQYVNQINGVAGEVYSITIDSDTLYNTVTNDSDLNLMITEGKTISVIGKDNLSNTPSRVMKVNLNWNTAGHKFTCKLTEAGKGYVGPVTIAVDSDSATLEGIIATVAPGAGFGTNLPVELGARNVMISVRNTPDVGDIMYNGSVYNLATLQIDPVETASNIVADKQNYMSCKSFTTEYDNTYVVGDRIISKYLSGSFVGLVVCIDGKRVYYTIPSHTNAYDSFKDSEVVELEGGGKINEIQKHYGSDIVFNSGSIIVTDYKDTDIKRSFDQIETFNFILEF